MSKTTKLMVPGPTPLPPQVREVMGRQTIYHRENKFISSVFSVVDSLKYLLYLDKDDDYTVLLIPGTGRASMEAALVNCFCMGDKVLGISNGHFGEMFSSMGTVLGLNMVSLKYEWENAVSADDVERMLSNDPEIKGILLTYIETSGAVQNDIAQIGKVARKHNVLLIVDAVSALGCAPIEMKEYGVDVVVSASQKGLMCPAGMSVAVLSPFAWEAVEKSNIKKYYFDFVRMKSFIQKGQTPVSTPVPIVLGMEASLNAIRDEGRENVFARHEELGNLIRSKAVEFGYDLYPNSDVIRRACSLSAFYVPEGLDSDTFVDLIEDKYDTLFAHGLGATRDTTFRIGHMGFFAREDAEWAIDILEKVRQLI